MTEFEFFTHIFNINRELIEKYYETLKKATININLKDDNAIDNIYNLKITINNLKKQQEQLTEKLQILAEKEK